MMFKFGNMLWYLNTIVTFHYRMYQSKTFLVIHCNHTIPHKMSLSQSSVPSRYSFELCLNIFIFPFFSVLWTVLYKIPNWLPSFRLDIQILSCTSFLVLFCAKIWDFPEQGIPFSHSRSVLKFSHIYS